MEKDRLLFTPGPLTTSAGVKQSMLRDIGSRDNEFLDVVREIRRRLLEIGRVADGSYEAVLMQGSGTFAVESVISSVIPAGGKLLVLINGAYGHRIAQIAKVLGIEPGNLMTATAPLLFTALEQDNSRWHGTYQADHSNLQNRRIFEEGTSRIRENPVLRKLARLTSMLDMEEADQGDANTLNYVLHEWVRAQGRLKCCAKE